MWTEEDVEALKLVILRRNRCLDGEHEADGSRILELGKASLVRVCLHCRGLFVEKP